MAIETDAMRLQYLKDFGVSDATYRDTSAGISATIYALLRKEYLEEVAGGEVGVESSTPFALVRTSDVPNVVQEDQITINGTIRMCLLSMSSCQPNYRSTLLFEKIFRD